MNALERRIGQRRGATRAPTQAPEWRGRLRAAPEKSDPPIHKLLGPKNGLDNGVHFINLCLTTLGCVLPNLHIESILMRRFAMPFDISTKRLEVRKAPVFVWLTSKTSLSNTM